MPLLSRRALLRTAAAAAVTSAATVTALESGVLPGRARIHNAVGLNGPDGVVPDVPAGPVVSGTFESVARGTTVGYTVMYPDGQRPDAHLPVALVLHGRGGDHTSAINDLGADRYLTDIVRSGTPPFALATVDGGQDSYWHDHPEQDPLLMLSAEFLPLLAKRGLRTISHGVLGWSMGGYGALRWALETRRPVMGRQQPAKVVAAGAMSPALWHDLADAAPGAFEDPKDAEFWDQVFGRADDFKDVAVRIDCGRDDPFAGAAKDLRTELRAAGGEQAGAHTAGYWRRMLPDQLRFLGAELAG
jgi:S-formylglutathione hydrolase FrmB